MGVRRVDLHSRFGATDRPVLVIGRIGDHLRLRMVYPRSLFDARGARRFVEQCIRDLEVG